VIVSHKGIEKELPLGSAKSFEVYDTGVMPISDGEMLLVTKNMPAANLYTGDHIRASLVDGHYLVTDRWKTGGYK
jgi:hypothetical protein